MDILRVESSLVCTRRIDGLQKTSLRVLANARGKRMVAVDPVGARPGNWVFVVEGSAARYAAGDFSVLTDLTIGGIIDYWDTEQADTSGAPKQKVG
ncbi:carboxysome shell protein [Thiohalorhabdus denitrificans]|uniref:Carboxysome peptide B n=1 Tax=Thiohalorhabdus denitrificans TaxID=381306 RepID=A0A0P9CRE1_9GAMM|nr:carboxysome peptide B [Thiohalorhabdus denitrificans]KPV39243.1 carboxysome shell protein [Thiohalorhabdus denitrificans]SCX74928.1 carboxysome peptide B [Thiohalorhabdus denitrificans]